MASVARALNTSSGSTTIHRARFKRPVIVPRDESRTVRLAGLKRRDGAVDVVLRSDETGFQADHFRATFRFGEIPRPRTAAAPPPSAIALDPAEHVYGDLAFHGPRFQRIRGYRELSARACVAEIETRDERWFGGLLPQGLELGDPGARDAAIHAVQACIPHGRLVPVGVERITVGPLAPGPLFARATERSQRGDTFVYDISLHDGDGTVLEHWDGIELQRIGAIPPPRRWAPTLLSTYLERRLDALVGVGRVHVTILHGDGPRCADADRALTRALSGSGLPRRADGQPIARNGDGASAARLDCWALAVAGAGPVACDIELVAMRTGAMWRDLLGAERYARSAGCRGRPRGARSGRDARLGRGRVHQAGGGFPSPSR